ncbi:MAG: DUF296 domain-containing protein [Anaplasmataceae bacterium]|nr:DUF296 domain-containing protein [Anaplasmataceae bacterium]
MKVIYQKESCYLIRFDADEEVISLVENFCIEHQIYSAVIWGIGAVNDLTISWYNLDEKKYHDHELKKKLEIASFHGNISLKDGKPVIHAHGSFSDYELHSRSGHVKKMIVSITAEIYLERLAGKIERQFSPETGLYLLE